MSNTTTTKRSWQGKGPHRWTSEEARAAGAKGRAAHKAREKQRWVEETRAQMLVDPLFNAQMLILALPMPLNAAIEIVELLRIEYERKMAQDALMAGEPVLDVRMETAAAHSRGRTEAWLN